VEREKEAGFLQSAIEARKKARPPIRCQPALDLKGYDLVVIGFPVWAGNPASPVNSLLASMSDVRGKRFALFSTSGGTGFERSLNAIARELESMGGNITARHGFVSFRRNAPVVAQEFARRATGGTATSA
jgi:hypothetical protein